jgi:hypothetical protein
VYSRTATLYHWDRGVKNRPDTGTGEAAPLPSINSPAAHSKAMRRRPSGTGGDVHAAVNRGRSWGLTRRGVDGVMVTVGRKPSITVTSTEVEAVR